MQLRSDERSLTKILAASDDSDKFDSIALEEESLRPFPAMNGNPVMLDQDRLRGQPITIDEFRDRFHSADVNRLAVK